MAYKCILSVCEMINLSEPKLNLNQTIIIPYTKEKHDYWFNGRDEFINLFITPKNPILNKQNLSSEMKISRSF